MDLIQHKKAYTNRFPKPTDFSNQRTVNYFQEQNNLSQNQNTTKLKQGQIKQPLYQQTLTEQQSQVRKRNQENFLIINKHENLIDLKSKQSSRPMMHQGDKPPDLTDLVQQINIQQTRNLVINQMEEEQIQSKTQILSQKLHKLDTMKQLSKFDNDFIEPSESDYYYVEQTTPIEVIRRDYQEELNEIQVKNQRVQKKSKTSENIQVQVLSNKKNYHSNKHKSFQKTHTPTKQITLKYHKRRAGTPQKIGNQKIQQQPSCNVSKQVINLEQVQQLEEKLAGMLEGLKMNAQSNVFSDE